MVDDVAAVWGGQIRLGRQPANNEILVGNTDGNFALAASSSISPSIQTLLDGISTTQGSILYRGASAWVALGPGTSGNVLSTNGAGANPSWVAQTPAYTPVWTDGVKTADQSMTSSTVLTDATDMSFSVAANTYYSFQFQIFVNVPGGSGTGGGLDISFTCPTGGTLYFGNTANVAGTTGSGTRYAVVTNLSINSPLGIWITGYLSNGANAGTLQLQFSQFSSSANTLTMRKGSWFQYRTV